MELNHIAGRVVVITGAGGGFGRSLARLAAGRGGIVVASDVDLDAAQATVDLIEQAGGDAVAVAADVAKRDDMVAVIRTAVDCYGAVDVIVNNAGVMPLAFFADHHQAWTAWDRAIDINIKGVLNGICASYDQMIRQGRGHVVNISSIYGNQATAGSGVYSATKAAVRILSDALRVESQGRIKVTVVRPTGVLGTQLGASVVNPEAIIGLTGMNTAEFGDRVARLMIGDTRAEETDIDGVGYWAIGPDELAAQILYAIDQPWGVTIADLTVRATGENFVI